MFDREAQFDAKREKILAAASQLFNRRGVDTTSLDDIAAAVGATKRTLYHYVGDKQTILSACYARTHRIFSFIREQAAAQGGSAIETLIAVLRANSISHQRDDIEPLRASTGYDSLSEAEKIACNRARQRIGAGLPRTVPGSAQRAFDARCEPRLPVAVHARRRQLARQRVWFAATISARRKSRQKSPIFCASA